MYKYRKSIYFKLWGSNLYNGFRRRYCCSRAMKIRASSTQTFSNKCACYRELIIMNSYEYYFCEAVCNFAACIHVNSSFVHSVIHALRMRSNEWLIQACARVHGNRVRGTPNIQQSTHAVLAVLVNIASVFSVVAKCFRFKSIRQ